MTAENGQTQCADQATIWRWREHFQHDFAARMDWCVADDFKKANHNPIAVLNGDTTKDVIELTAKPGETVTLSAAGSKDPDGDAVSNSWLVYREAGRFRGEITLSATIGETTSFVIPDISRPGTVHVILEVRDNGTPNLWAYRRASVKIEPPRIR